MNTVLPASVLIDVTLQEGAVYYFINPDDSFKSEEPHYFVVLNNPLDGIDTVLICATTKIGETQLFVVKRRLPAETVVRVRPEEYTEFSKETIFNCNHPFVYSRSFLEKLIEDKRMVKAALPIISNEILTKLKNGVLASTIVEVEIQKLICIVNGD